MRGGGALRLLLLVALVVGLVAALHPQVAAADCTGCWMWVTEQTGIEYCYVTCLEMEIIAKPWPPQQMEEYCRYFGPTYELKMEYFPNSEPDYENSYIALFIVFHCAYFDADLCEDFECPEHLSPPYVEYETREVVPCIPCG